MHSNSVIIPAIKTIQACQDMIALLQAYAQRQGNIGMQRETLAPDSLLRFFIAHNLRFHYCIDTPNLQLGERSAYQRNIDTLQEYIDDLRKSEANTVHAMINQLQVYEANKWAIGLNPQNQQADAFLQFFAVRELPFAYFVREHGLKLGNETAYQRNIDILHDYLRNLLCLSGANETPLLPGLFPHLSAHPGTAVQPTLRAA